MSKASNYSKTQADLAAWLGVNPRTLRDWIDNHGLKCFEPGRGYHIPSAVQWAIANRWTTKEPATPETDDRREDAELRKAEADASIKEARAEQLLSALVDRDAVKAAIRVLLDSIRDRLRTVPEEVGTVIPEAFRADIVLDIGDKVALIITEIDSAESAMVPVGSAVAVDDDQEPEQEVIDLEG